MADLTRRAFLQISAAGGGALAATLGIKKIGKLIPYVVPPENIKPGTWVHYATTCRECPAGCGMHVRHRDGRAVKCEGNPDHPISHGGLCARGQSAVQGLYDPDRVKTPLKREGNKLVPATWEEALSAIAKKLKANPGVGICTDLQTGALREIMTAFATKFRGAVRWCEPITYSGISVAHMFKLGGSMIPRYHLDRSDFILSLGADFLETWLSPVEFAHGFAQTRTIKDGKPAGRMVYAGPRLSMTAANADEFISLSPELLPQLAMAMLGVIIREKLYSCDNASLDFITKDAGPLPTDVPGLSADQIVHLATSFAGARGAVALPGLGPSGSGAPYSIARAAMLLNLSVSGKTSDRKPVWEIGNHALSLAGSLPAVEGKSWGSGPVGAVVFLHNTNLAYESPGMADVLKRVDTVVQLTTLHDETSELAHWVLPIDSPLESWGDYEPYNGVHCFMQPTTARLHDTRHGGDIFLALADAAGRPLENRPGRMPASFQQWLKERWENLQGQTQPSGLVNGDEQDGFADFWEQTLRKGFFVSAATGGSIQIGTLPNKQFPETFEYAQTQPHVDDRVSLWLYPSPMLFDGRVANRPWLQEAPDPTTSNTWGSWLDVHPTLAAKLDVKDSDIVRVSAIKAITDDDDADAQPSTDAGESAGLLASARHGEAPSVEIPVRVTTDVIENTVAAALGQGHWAKGLRTAAGRGVNLMGFLSSRDLVPGKVEIVKTGKRGQLYCTSATQEQKHREIMQWVAADKLAAAAPKAREYHLPLAEGYSKATDIIPPHAHVNHRWGMVIDLHRCIGCGACAVACQAENNVAVVGPAEVAKGREMSWLKVVPYRQDHNNSDRRDACPTSRLGFLPMLCQHCDTAPCESVCPVYAAVNNEEGLNLQVYNRCIGTRYCSNNCPYKVRRFNWFDHKWPTPTDWQLNPDVTVRSRGVMEKCTFCLQRIREAQNRAKRDNRTLADGEIKPACAQSCPTQAIVFGDLMLKGSRVYELMTNDPRRYQVLGELNTKTAVVYLKRVRSS